MSNIKCQSPGRWLVLAFALVALLGANIAEARAAHYQAPKGKRIWDTKHMDINRWHLPFYNDGRFAIDITQQNFPGGYWPAPVKNFYLFGGGLWVGAITEANETLVTIGYNPNSGAGEFYPTISKNVAEGTGNSKDRVYKYGTADWPPDQSRYVTEPRDTLLVPKENFSLQDFWMAFTDVYAPQHTSPGTPLGLDVYLTVYAWNYPSNQDIFFLTYKVKNVTRNIPEDPTPRTLRKIFFGVCNDNDIGDATDDMVGMIKKRANPANPSDTVENVGYVGDNNNSEVTHDKWQSGTPGVCAMKFLESPRTPEGGQYGMSAFKKFTIDIDPVTDATQYLTMAGFDYMTGIYSAYDSLDETPQDKRIIQCSGPFDLEPDSVQTIIVAVFGSPYGREGVPWGARTDADLQDIITTAQSAQFIYDRGWLLPGPPEAPNLTLVPLDNKVQITWDNHSEITPARYYRVSSDTSTNGWDPLYRKFDFQGYKVWKSENGTDWKLLKQCDLIDGDTFRDTTQAESVRTWPSESGIFYTLVDDSVINGFTYYYAVSAYCHNKATTRWTPETETLRPPYRVPADSSDIFLEGGKRGIPVIPRWNSTNLDSAIPYITKLVGDQVKPGLVCTSRVVVPYKLNPADTFVAQFLAPTFSASDVPIYRWVVYKLYDTVPVTDTFEVAYRLGDFSSAKLVKTDLPIVNGIATTMKLKMGKPGIQFDSAVPGGSYPRDSVKVVSATGTPMWSFRGSDYRVVWHRNGGDLYAEVLDASNRIDGRIITDPTVDHVPFVHFSRTVPESTNGWCFLDASFRNPTSIINPAASAYLYVCGGYIALNKGAGSARAMGAMADMVAEGDEWYLGGFKGNGTSPAYNTYLITGKPEMTIDSVRSDFQLRVRTVPNPYMITNRWETNTWERKLAFVGLPSTCDIRIYTMAGDLVRLIRHKDTREKASSGGPAPQKGDLGGTEFWDLLNSNQQLVATGIYIFHVKSDVGEQVGKFAIVR